MAVSRKKSILVEVGNRYVLIKVVAVELSYLEQEVRSLSNRQHWRPLNGRNHFDAIHRVDKRQLWTRHLDILHYLIG